MHILPQYFGHILSALLRNRMMLISASGCFYHIIINLLVTSQMIMSHDINPEPSELDMEENNLLLAQMP